MAYLISFPPPLANLHGVFHVSQLMKYIPVLFHVIQVDNIQVRENLNVEASPLRIENQEVKQLHGKEIALVKVVWGGPGGGSITWELETKMR